MSEFLNIIHARIFLKIEKFVFCFFKNLNSGFTLAELMISTVILSFLLVTSSAVYTNFYNSVRNIKAANLVYEEANFTMERIIKEIRSGSVDYEEYYNQAANFFGIDLNETYGQNYCQYSRQFYSAGPDGQFGTFDDESTGVRNLDPSTGEPMAGSVSPIKTPIQNKLYLVDAGGSHRTYVEKITIQKTDASGKPVGAPIGKIGMLKLVGKDYGIDHLAQENGSNCPKDTGEKDGLIDTWACDKGYMCKKEPINLTLPTGPCSGQIDVPLDTPGHLNDTESSFVDITPETIDVVDLKFIITPPDDPRKAYADPNVQVQPNVTVKLVAKAAPQISSTFRGQSPTIILESTISTRATNEIITECNLQECIEGDPKPCPKSTGLLAGAEQICSQGIWPGCMEEGVGSYADVAKYNVLNNPFNDPLIASLAKTVDGKDPETNLSYYDSTGSEIGSCAANDDGCKSRRCTDTVDNDVNGKADNDDPACLFYICNNGHLDPGEECIDVGGICFFRPKLPVEDSDTCSDGIDNDCSYNFDLKKDPNWWTNLAEPLKKRIEGEGLNQYSSVAQINIALGQGADEYDQNCIEISCSNGIKDPQITPFGPKYYETPYYFVPRSSLPQSKELDEQCIDVGGLCARATDSKPKVTEETGDLCYDKLDNDCNFNPAVSGTGADEFDANCKQTICTNNAQDCDLAPSTYEPKNYLKGFTGSCDQSRDFPTIYNLSELCTDIGGICGGKPFREYELIDSSGQTIVVNQQCLDPLTGEGDGIDNDCDGEIDGADSDCCPDMDIDYTAAKTQLCEPDAPFVDCNDADNSIFPDTDPAGNIENFCDNAVYPSTYPDLVLDNELSISLKNTPIDDNCHAANGVGGEGWDDEDITCCVDSDDDGFGIKEALLYDKTPPACVASGQIGTLDLTERPTVIYNTHTGSTKTYAFDCDDVNPNINPATKENTKPLCSDGLNNSCRFLNSDPMQAPHKDHIDMYAVTHGLQTAFANKLFNPDCCVPEMYPIGSMARKYPGMEICDDGNSLLGVGLNSDENCNGFEGVDDIYCVGGTGLKFYDNFLSKNYINSATNAEWNETAGSFTVNPADVPSQTILSNSMPVDESTCLQVATVKLEHDATLPIDTNDPPVQTTIVYEVSNDNGTTWEPVEVSEDGVDHTHTFGSLCDEKVTDCSTPLKWRATLNGNGIDTVPTLKSITLTWTCS